MSTQPIRISDDLEIGGAAPLVLIAGPDLVENERHALKMAEALSAIARARGVPLIYKSSFDKANRTSVSAERGPGLEEGLRIRAWHLPQIAVYGDHHFRVHKGVSDGRTKSGVERLETRERPEEIARMLGGLQIAARTRAAAKEMLQLARRR